MDMLRVVVLMGGMSSEHDVSLASGANVVAALDRSKYEVTPVTITRDGLWLFPDSEPIDIFGAVPRLKSLGIQCAVLALHGAFGEDGRIQGMLDLLGIPYTSSGCGASAIAIDKLRAKTLVRDAGVHVARQITYEAGDGSAETLQAQVARELGFPCVIKSPCQGSSVGMAIPRTPDAFPRALRDVLEYGPLVMVEEFIAGTEVTCAVLDIEPGKTPRALPVTEIRPVDAEFFDYHAKYTPGASLEITPAEIDPAVAAEVQELAVRAHMAVGCAIWSRSDMLLGPDGPVWIEVNTVPGMTPTSLYPQAAAAAGIPYPKLMDLFIEAAIRRYGRS